MVAMVDRLTRAHICGYFLFFPAIFVELASTRMRAYMCDCRGSKRCVKVGEETSSWYRYILGTTPCRTCSLKGSEARGVVETCRADDRPVMRL